MNLTSMTLHPGCHEAVRSEPAGRSATGWAVRHLTSARPLTAENNSGRLTPEAGLAASCGVGPVLASSGTTARHHLNPGGDRAVTSALRIIATGRLRTGPRTKAHVAKRIAEGRSKLEAIQCPKRCIARETLSLSDQRGREINRGLIIA